MAQPDTLYAAPVAVGAKDGSSLADAAAIDPGDANDIWTIANDDVAALGNSEVLLCADDVVTTTGKIEITRDGAVGGTFVVRGRNAANTADAQVVLDADGGAFPVVQLTAADYWCFLGITAQNTNKAAGNYAWELTSGADYVTLYNCEGLSALEGIYRTGGGSYAQIIGGEYSNNTNRGLYLNTSSIKVVGVVANANGNNGILCSGVLLNCVCSNNGGHGASLVTHASGCTFFGNAGDGCNCTNNAFVRDCIATENGGYGCECSVTGFTVLANFAHYLNTSGALVGLRQEFNTIALSANPFVDKANRDFRLNSAVGGGAACRGLGYVSPDGNWVSYADLGAVQAKDRIVCAVR